MLRQLPPGGLSEAQVFTHICREYYYHSSTHSLLLFVLRCTCFVGELKHTPWQDLVISQVHWHFSYEQHCIVRKKIHTTITNMAIKAALGKIKPVLYGPQQGTRH